MEMTSKILEGVKKIPKMAAEEKWVLTLDLDEGSLFYSPEKIPDETELYQVSDEYAVYFDKNFNPKGIMLEYYNYNFVNHHPEFKELTEEVFGKKDNKSEEIIVLDPNKKNHKDIALQAFRTLLEGTIMIEAVTSPVK